MQHAHYLAQERCAACEKLMVGSFISLKQGSAAARPLSVAVRFTIAIIVVLQGGDLAVYDDEDLCTTYRMEPDAYTTSCMVFFKGMIG